MAVFSLISMLKNFFNILSFPVFDFQLEGSASTCLQPEPDAEAKKVACIDEWKMMNKGAVLFFLN
ncbi:MAG: hypothetical protein NWE95_08500 [Candidatus Bathyarchaeota archaeon]|nr:hypothetical protein [Candidatus Bathyarchaeota archaeon]